MSVNQKGFSMVTEDDDVVFSLPTKQDVVTKTKQDDKGMLMREHEAKQLTHAGLTHEDFMSMKDKGCPVCEAQRKAANENA